MAKAALVVVDAYAAFRKLVELPGFGGVGKPQGAVVAAGITAPGEGTPPEKPQHLG